MTPQEQTVATYISHRSTLVIVIYFFKSLVDEILLDLLSTNGPVECMSLAWNADGQTLFAGYTESLIR